MDNKKQRINEFLKYIRDIIKQNPNHIITKNEVYHELTRLGVPEEEKRVRVNDFFNHWTNYYLHTNKVNKTKCDSFVDPHWPYFCQFISNSRFDNEARKSPDHIKVYIPLDSKHIQLGAIRIFNFLQEEGIAHVSKIGSDIRFDDIVVRLTNTKDLHTLLEFLKSSKYIQEGLMPANPFLFNENGIPLAVDGHLSFNSTIANLIKIYMDEKKNTNTLDSVNIDDFYTFINNYYKKSFSSEQGINHLYYDFDLDDVADVYGEDVAENNLREVFELIIKSNSPEFSMDDYIAHFEKCLTDKKNPTEKKVDYSDKDIEEINNKILYVLDIMTNKFQNEIAAIVNVAAYLEFGEEHYLTREHNLRNDITNSDFREKVNNFLNSQGISFTDYLNILLNERKKSESHEKQVQKSSTEKEVLETVKRILNVMTKKYGQDAAIGNLIEYAESGRPELLTRDENLRYDVCNSTFRKDFAAILELNNMTVLEYIEDVLGFGTKSNANKL